LENPSAGWGLDGDTWNTLEGITRLGGANWFKLGDRDLATHLERTDRLQHGKTLSEITRHFCQMWGIKITVLPASDDNVPTWVYTEEGVMPFQEYFVRRQCHPEVKGFRFEDVESAHPAPGVQQALENADVIVICPSNPWVSIDPILAIPGILPMVQSCPVLAVSPIIAGRTVKGPAAKMYAELGIQPSALAVARHYAAMLRGFVFDRIDNDQAESIRALGIAPFTTDTWMRTPQDRRRLAGDVLEFANRLLSEPPDRTQIRA
jgi:LPPG:FO 2-phospho-L-lactate transferase